MQSLFVSGTDTGVGKTFVSAALARGLRARGTRIGVMKPIETGVPETGPLDALALREAAGVSDDLDLICPLQYRLPATPEAAARAEGRDLSPASVARIEETFATLNHRYDGLLVEGAGGLLVPILGELKMVDLAAKLRLPILLVARTQLGTINHTLLSLEACAQHGASVLGVVLSHSDGPLSDADTANLDILKNHLGDQLLAEIPPLPADDPASAATTTAALSEVIHRILE